MAAYNLNYPIFAEVNYTLISQALKYVYYRIRASYPSSQAGTSLVVIANGRSFVDSTGSTKIRLDQILKAARRCRTGTALRRRHPALRQPHQGLPCDRRRLHAQRMVGRSFASRRRERRILEAKNAE